MVPANIGGSVGREREQLAGRLGKLKCMVRTGLGSGTRGTETQKSCWGIISGTSNASSIRDASHTGCWLVRASE